MARCLRSFLAALRTPASSASPRLQPSQKSKGRQKSSEIFGFSGARWRIWILAQLMAARASQPEGALDAHGGEELLLVELVVLQDGVCGGQGALGPRRVCVLPPFVCARLPFSKGR